MKFIESQMIDSIFNGTWIPKNQFIGIWIPDNNFSGLDNQTIG